jgi:putative lipoprotein
MSFVAAVGALVDRFVTGQVTHNGPTNIEANSKVQIQLQDTSLMDTAAVIIGTTTLNNVQVFPIPYKVKYSPSAIVIGHTYSMSARITGPSGNLLFINDLRSNVQLNDSITSGIDIPVRISENTLE